MKIIVIQVKKDEWETVRKTNSEQLARSIRNKMLLDGHKASKVRIRVTETKTIR